MHHMEAQGKELACGPKRSRLRNLKQSYFDTCQIAGVSSVSKHNRIRVIWRQAGRDFKAESLARSLALEVKW